MEHGTGLDGNGDVVLKVAFCIFESKKQDVLIRSNSNVQAGLSRCPVSMRMIKLNTCLCEFIANTV